jgi:hypothetical protein
MASTTAPITQTIPPYPATAVAAVMQEELLRAVRSRFRRKGQPLPIADDEVVLLVRSKSTPSPLWSCFRTSTTSCPSK